MQEENFPAEAGKAPPAKPEEPKSPFAGMKYRLVGPFRGGRVVAHVSGVPGDVNTYYMGSTGGGMWKSQDGGLNWRPLWDKFLEASPSVGAIAVAPSDSNVLYVGTGEACIRGNVIVGNGVYKSIDGGKNWKAIGLKDTGAIGRLIVHPTNADVAFVAALGHPFGPNTARGVFRTKDGGKTWERVLYIDDNTGAIDISVRSNLIRIFFSRRCGRQCASRGLWNRRSRQRALPVGRWRQHLEAAERPWFAQGTLGRIGRGGPLRIRIAFTR